MEFKHSIESRIYIKATRDHQIFRLTDVALAEFDTPRLALAGVMSLWADFLGTAILGPLTSVQIFSQTDTDKEILITASARVRIKATGKRLRISYKYCADSGSDYATYHSNAITALNNMLDPELYAYDYAEVQAEPNPQYVEPS